MKGMFKYLVTWLCAVLLLAAPVRAQANDAPADIIHQFYAAREFKPVWTDSDRFLNPAEKMPEILEGAALHGLDPQTYGVTRMQTVLKDDLPVGQNAWHQAEVFWTYNVWRYASDLLGQKLDADMLADLVDGDGKDIAQHLDALAPNTPLYSAMRDRLKQIDAEDKAAAEAAKAGNPVVAPELIKFSKSAFKPGMSAPSVPLLRARMAEYGAPALPADATPDAANLYDEELAKAVAAFQLDYGLKSDGVIGAVTLGILNRSHFEERRQLVANMQRMREPHRRWREDRRIEVSIARFMLTAIENGKGVLTMPVVVGQPRRQTISFRTEITGVRVNPTWTVPNTIRNEDFIPMLGRDPAKLVRKHGLKFTKDGRNFDPTQVDWTQVSAREMAQVSMWAPAGQSNPLGLYRVIMDNPYDIYLHDTNHPELFAGTMRALSSGCVRVEKPALLTDFILQGKEGWDPQKTKDLVAKGQTRDVIIENKLPIYLDYTTAWLNDRGHLVLGNDIYALDKPRYDTLVNNVLTTQRNAQKLLDEAARILQPELKEARQDIVLKTTSN